jgi:proline-specific peptidase
MRSTSTIVALLVLGFTACSEKASEKTDTVAKAATDTTAVAALPAGEHKLTVPGGTIWYKTSGASTGTPVILLHGGPGYSSFYLKPMEALGSDRPVVRYDQLGGGKSDKTTDTTMYTIPHFVAELDSLRSALHYDKVHLVGHSWGTILGLEYYRAHPEHVASLTLASAALSIPAWEKNAKRLVTTLSDSAQRAIKTREAEGKFDAPDYQKALEEFYGKYVWLRPVQADLDSTMATVNEGIYGYMQGPSEFTITGTLKKYDSTPFLKDVKVPVLFTVGEFDEADPPTIKKQSQMTPGAKYVVIPNSAHLTTWDNPDAQLKAVREFLLAVDSTKK